MSDTKRTIKSIGEIFRTEPGLEKLRKKFDESDLLYRFHEAFPHFTETVQAVRIDKKVLYLFTENSVLASEVKHNEVEILAKLNEHFPYPQIKAIRFSSTAKEK